MTIVEHLEELRRRLLIAFAALGVGTLLGWAVARRALDFLIVLMGIDRVVFMSPSEGLFVQLKVAFFLGVFIGLPVILYQFWSFIAVGLTHRERRGVLMLLPPSIVLFLAGASFGLFVIMPIGVRVLLSYSTDRLQPLLAVGPTLSFLMAFVLSFWVVVQNTMVVVVLAPQGVGSPPPMAGGRRYAIVGIVILSAFLTPGTDVVSQMLMAVPTYLLYELSIILARFVAPKTVPQVEAAVE